MVSTRAFDCYTVRYRQATVERNRSRGVETDHFRTGLCVRNSESLSQRELSRVIVVVLDVCNRIDSKIAVILERTNVDGCRAVVIAVVNPPEWSLSLVIHKKIGESINGGSINAAVDGRASCKQRMGERRSAVIGEWAQQRVGIREVASDKTDRGII